MSEVIDRFEGVYHFLSNYEECPIEYRGRCYGSTEAAYQAQKVDKKGFRQGSMYPAIMSLFEKCTPHEAKALGSRVPLKAGWDECKGDVMREVLQVKFDQQKYWCLLQCTGNDTLIEGNRWHDNYFGSCRCDKCGNHGKNMLGTILMEIRGRIRKELVELLRKRQGSGICRYGVELSHFSIDPDGFKARVSGTWVVLPDEADPHSAEGHICIFRLVQAMMSSLLCANAERLHESIEWNSDDSACGVLTIRGVRDYPADVAVWTEVKEAEE